MRVAELPRQHLAVRAARLFVDEIEPREALRPADAGVDPIRQRPVAGLRDDDADGVRALKSRRLASI